MTTPRSVGLVVQGMLRAAERRFVRPLAQALRGPRSLRARRRAMPREAEELLVAVLRRRLRDGTDGVAAGSAGASADPLVAGLLAARPRGGEAADVGRAGRIRRVA